MGHLPPSHLKLFQPDSSKRHLAFNLLYLQAITSKSRLDISLFPAAIAVTCFAFRNIYTILISLILRWQSSASILAWQQRTFGSAGSISDILKSQGI